MTPGAGVGLTAWEHRTNNRPAMWRLILLAVLIAGCGGPVKWHHATKTTEQFHADEYRCIQQSTYGHNAFGPLRDVTIYRACMRAAGYNERD